MNKKTCFDARREKTRGTKKVISFVGGIDLTAWDKLWFFIAIVWGFIVMLLFIVREKMKQKMEYR